MGEVSWGHHGEAEGRQAEPGSARVPQVCRPKLAKESGQRQWPGSGQDPGGQRRNFSQVLTLPS